MNNNGFTLMELLVTIAIIGLLLALTVPQIVGTNLQGATWTIYSDLQSARAQAIKNKNNFRLIFDGDGRTYQVHDDANSDDVIDAGEATSKDINDDYPGITFTTSPTLKFISTGSGDSGTVTVRDECSSNFFHSKDIVVSSNGRIRIDGEEITGC